jgi:hypothetical protein
MKKLLDRTLLLKKEVLEIEQVDLGKDEFIYVKQMTGRDRDKFEQSLLTEKKDKNGEVIGFDRATEDFRAKLAVRTVCDAEGNLLMEPGDYELLSQNMSAARLEKIVNAAQKLNMISETDKENLVKNSVGDQVASSTSDSAEN